MKRGQSKAKTLKRGGRIRSAPTKAKTRNGRKDASATGSAKKLAAKLRAYREASASPDEIATLKRALAEAHERVASLTLLTSRARGVPKFLRQHPLSSVGLRRS